MADWLAISSPEETLRAPSTFLAFLAAHAMWSMASTISSWASPCGLPVSRCERSASWAMRRVITLRQVSRCSARSSKDRLPHQSTASRARATAASTSARLLTGWVPTTSPLVGSSESNVSVGAPSAPEVVVGSKVVLIVTP